MKRRRTLPGWALGGVIAVALGGCGVGSDSSADPLGAEDVPLALSPATTTTSSTTTTVAGTAASPSSIPSTSTTVVGEPVSLYFVAGSRLVAVEAVLPRRPSLGQVARALGAGPTMNGLRTVLTPSLIDRVTFAGGVATVDLDRTDFDAVDPADQRLAIGQIVLTLTSRPGVGQVAFSVEGTSLAIPRPGGPADAPGSPVAGEDFADLLSTTPLPSTPEPPPRDLPDDRRYGPR